MRGWICAVLGGLVLCVIQGCSPDAMMDSFTSPEDKARASGCIQKLRDGEFDDIESHIDPTLRTPGLRDTFMRMRALIPAGQPDSVKLVGAQTNHQGGVRLSNLTYQYQFGDRWLLINCASRIENDQALIMGLNVHMLPASLEEQNRFTLVGKTGLHYSMLAAMALVIALTLAALVLCARHRGLRRKWAWILFILFGMVAFSLNWNTGAWALKPLYLLLFSVGAYANPYGPWELSVAVPLGALVYLFRFARNQNASAQSYSEPTPE